MLPLSFKDLFFPLKRKARESPQGRAAGVLSQRSVSGPVLAFALNSLLRLEPTGPSQQKEVLNAEAVDKENGSVQQTSGW